MSYRWPQDPEELFAERYPQMLATGLPAAGVDAVRATITDMWADTAGGWVHEWSRLAAGYADAARHDLAALAYGWAKFPTLADDRKRAALADQVEQYRLAAPGFPVDFHREVLDLPYRGRSTAVPVHLLATPGLAADAPVLLASGGVDSWKMDVHNVLVRFAQRARVRVLAFDIAGTGESEVPMTPDGGAEIVDGLIAHARALGNGTVAHLGISMGGYYSARSGLTGQVDAAIDLGGPVEAAFTRGRETVFGMSDILGNALGFAHRPTDAELGRHLPEFSLRSLLDQDRNAPMLVLNGADDVHVPQHDTLVFTGRRETEVDLVPDTGHCAVSKAAEVWPSMIEWLVRTLDR
ncbi:alpha/beta fold hydrolase [Sciscionella marina]|uniref:alpha/beta fold hydrolase n=1 Tax=Sciscionella marina TaxID=508770 RepID=UPI000369A717|nr:alpha/beta fold hydrolase [Sciscionella marina]